MYQYTLKRSVAIHQKRSVPMHHKRSVQIHPKKQMHFKISSIFPLLSIYTCPVLPESRTRKIKQEVLMLSWMHQGKAFWQTKCAFWICKEPDEYSIIRVAFLKIYCYFNLFDKCVCTNKWVMITLHKMCLRRRLFVFSTYDCTW